MYARRVPSSGVSGGTVGEFVLLSHQAIAAEAAEMATVAVDSANVQMTESAPGLTNAEEVVVVSSDDEEDEGGDEDDEVEQDDEVGDFVAPDEEDGSYDAVSAASSPYADDDECDEEEQYVPGISALDTANATINAIRNGVSSIKDGQESDLDALRTLPHGITDLVMMVMDAIDARDEADKPAVSTTAAHETSAEAGQNQTHLQAELSALNARRMHVQVLLENVIAQVVEAQERLERTKAFLAEA